MRTVLVASLAAAGAAGAASDIYGAAPSTTLGCECASPCSVGLLFHCNAAPVCKVKSRHCSKGQAEWSFSLASHYDYCVYGPDEAYEALPAAKKKAMVLAHVTADTVPESYPPLLSVLGGIMLESVRVSFEASADVFPESRKKWIHSSGVVGGIRFESLGGHPFTGLFEGAEHGLVRFSAAKEPSADGGIAPGMGIKFFRDGRPSANFVAMYSLDGQPCADGDSDFFAHEWSNHIAKSGDFGLKIIAAKFWQASSCPLMVGVSDLSSDASGKAGSFPFQLKFRPLVEAKCPCGDYGACMAKLESIAVGTRLFEVSAVARPGRSAQPQVIGYISLTEALTTSKFGDTQLFFRHQHMEEDFELEPSWLSSLNDGEVVCGMPYTGGKPPAVSVGCTSPFNPSRAGMLDSDMVAPVVV